MKQLGQWHLFAYKKIWRVRYCNIYNVPTKKVWRVRYCNIYNVPTLFWNLQNECLWCKEWGIVAYGQFSDFSATYNACGTHQTHYPLLTTSNFPYYNITTHIERALCCCQHVITRSLFRTFLSMCFFNSMGFFLCKLIWKFIVFVMNVINFTIINHRNCYRHKWC